MIKYLTIVMLFITYPSAAIAAQVDFLARNDEGVIESTWESDKNRIESSRLNQGIAISSSLIPMESSLSLANRFDEVSQEQDIGTVQNINQRQTSGMVLPQSNSFESSLQSNEMSGLWPLAAQNHFALISGSRELLSQIIDDENTLEAVIEETVNLAQQFNNAWNDLDDQLTRKLYQGLGYMGFADVFYNGENSYDQRAAIDFKDKLYASSLISESDNYVEPGGFFGFILKLPKLFTFNNLLLLMGVLLAGNGLFRIMRYILLRI